MACNVFEKLMREGKNNRWPASWPFPEDVPLLVKLGPPETSVLAEGSSRGRT